MRERNEKVLTNHELNGGQYIRKVKSCLEGDEGERVSQKVNSKERKKC